MKLPGYYSSGQFAKMASVSVRTIRFYDKQNILKLPASHRPVPVFIQILILPGCSRFFCSNTLVSHSMTSVR